jgi:hypothetical protein
MVKAISKVVKHLVVHDTHPDTLGKLACLNKATHDKMMRLTCRKNQLAAENKQLDDLAFWKTECKLRDGTTGEYKKLWSDVAEEAEIDRVQDFRAMQEEMEQQDREIKQRDRRIQRLEAVMEVIKEKLTTASTHAVSVRAALNIAADTGTRALDAEARDNAKSTLELIEDSRMLLDFV